MKKTQETFKICHVFNRKGNKAERRHALQNKLSNDIGSSGVAIQEVQHIVGTERKA